MGVQIPPLEGTIFGKRGVHCEVYRLSAVSCAKMAQPIDLPFGLWTWVGQKKYKFNHICQVAPFCTSAIIFTRWRQSTVHLWRRCGLMSNYSDHLLLLGAKADDYFTMTWKVEGWFDLDNKGCISQWLSTHNCMSKIQSWVLSPPSIVCVATWPLWPIVIRVHKFLPLAV